MPRPAFEFPEPTHRPQCCDKLQVRTLMNPLSSFGSPILPSLLRWSPVIVAVTLLAACQGGPPFACGTIPAQELYPRQTAELEPCFEDPEGEELTLFATSSDADITSVRVSGLEIMIKGESVGSATITVTASDPDGLTASMDIAVLVPRPVDVGR